MKWKKVKLIRMSIVHYQQWCDTTDSEGGAIKLELQDDKKNHNNRSETEK